MNPKTDIPKLARAALAAAGCAYAPYSHFCVGAALLCDDQSIYTGCNVENAAYPATICAERTAISKAVSDGKTRFSAIAITGALQGEKPQFCPPCGTCRQVMAEFCVPAEFLIILVRSERDYRVYTLDDLFPLSFGPDNLGKEI
jgi:cytidine deaminase